MTRFEQELSGSIGAFWKRDAEERIARMQAQADNGEIRTNMNGGAFWNSNGNYLPADAAEVLSHTDFEFSLEETARARKVQTAMQLEAYRKNYRGPSEEEKAEMRAAFGPGTTVVDVISGDRIQL